MAILDKSAIVEKIKALAKEQGYSLNYMYKQTGLPSGYIRDVIANKTALTDERLFLIADFLRTTPEYLKGESEQKEKATAVSGDDLSDVKKAMIDWVVNTPDAELEALYRFLRKNEAQAVDSQ